MARGQLYWSNAVDAPASNPVADAMAALGIYCEDDADVVIDEDEFWLWPENDEAFWLWVSIQTQWVVGMAGRFGLNYSGVEACMRMRGVRKNRQHQFFVLIQMMENAALEEWATQR